MSFMQEAGIIRTAPFFRSIRENGWNPLFHWTEDVKTCADHINRPHEDHPRRVESTERAIIYVMGLNQKAGGELHITSQLIKDVHRYMFPDHADRAGQWRQTNVRVASHLPPKWELMDNMMAELEFHYAGLNMDQDTLEKWYFDFETIHPYIDGNGRAGGVIIAGLSFHENRQFLTPGQ